MSARPDGFDEVLIVNPYDPSASLPPQTTSLMQFHEAPEFGYYAEPPELGYYGEPELAYYGEGPELGYYAEPAELGYYGEPPYLGYYGEPPYLGGYAEGPELGYYGEPAELGYYGEPADLGYYAEPADLGYYVAEAPEMVGYHEYEPLGEDPLAEAELNGYVRPERRRFNPGCPLPTNVAGFAEGPLDGYVPPRPVNPRVTHFTPPVAGGGNTPDTFRPLW